ncbi:phosphoribosylanthranilate isomerase [Roseiconus sp. JC912]
MFRVKICGVRLKKDVEAVGRSGADAIGLNFFPPSVRYVDPASESTQNLSKTAQELGLLRVGVFVNNDLEQLRSIAASVGLDALQLHGDEPVELAKQLIADGIRVIRAIKLPRTELSAVEIQTVAQPWIDAGVQLLLDADAGAAHGGSGKTLDWASIKRWSESAGEVEWTLAGGLKPENIADAVASTGAVSIDTASGVECPKGVKNEQRILDFASQSGLV